MSRVLALLALVRCAQAGSPIKWTLNPSYVLDVDGFAGPNPPKPIMLWNRPGGDYNGNEFFDHNANDDSIRWSQAGLCLEAAGDSNKAAIQVNNCDSSNNYQRWTLVKTNYGVRIQLKYAKPAKCVNVPGNEGKSGKHLWIWDCENDKTESFSFDDSSPPAPSPSPTPSSKCPNVCHDSGFQVGDCRCDDHGSWAMWVCGKKGGQSQSKPWFCSQPGCHCNQMMAETVAPKLLRIPMLKAGDTGVPIKWTYNPSYVLDVDGFVGPNPPKPIMIWNRPGGDYNGNEFFLHNANDASIRWAQAGLCLEAAGDWNRAAIQVNNCDSNNLNQKWTLAKTNYGVRIQLECPSPAKCVNVIDNQAKSGQKLQIWDCNDDRKMSFSLDDSSPPAPSPSPTPSSKCPNVCHNSGFQGGDCRCDDHGSWAMWVCSKKGGQWQNKPWFCSQPGCHCNQMMEEAVATTAVSGQVVMV